MTSDLAQTALEFCRECLGWEDVIALPEESSMEEAAIIVRGDAGTALYYTDLNAVMKAVEEFCSGHGLFVRSCRSPVLVTWQSTILRHGLETSLGVDYPTLGHALLAASIEAARKLKEAA